MTKQEFMPVFVKLCKYYNQKIDEENTNIYYSSLKNMPIFEFRKKCAELIKANKYIPKVSEFYESNGIKVHVSDFSNLTDLEWEKFYDVGGKK